MDRAVIVVLTGLTLAACARPDAEQVSDTASPPRTDLGRYLGQSEVVGQETVGDAVATTFGGRAGCMRGAPFVASTRDAGAADLVFFLQGGGACWDDYCLAVTTAPPGVPRVDILDPELPENPVADWNVTYLPYCDGSLFVGDADRDDDGDGVAERQHRGLANLSAALDLSRETFPDPERVLFVGSSGGGYGALFAVPLLQETYPDAELLVLSDSAVGVARGSDPAFVQHLVDQWGAAGALGDVSLASGHMTGLLERNLEDAPDARVAVFSAWYDLIIGDVFLKVPPAAFQQDVAEETDRLHAAFPDRYRRFLIDGRMHTTLLGDASGIVGSDLGSVEVPVEDLGALAAIELGGLDTTVSASGMAVHAWVAAFLEGGSLWTDVVDAPGPAPE